MVNGDGKYYVIQLVVSGESCRNHSAAEPVAFHASSPALIGLSSHFYRAVVYSYANAGVGRVGTGSTSPDQPPWIRIIVSGVFSTPGTVLQDVSPNEATL